MGLTRALTAMTNAGGKQQLPADGYGTLDAGTPYKALTFALPAGAKGIAVYAKDCDDPRYTLSRLVADGDVLTSATSCPFPTNQWFLVPLGLAGNTDADSVRAVQLSVCGNTVSADIFVLAVPSDE